MPRQGKVAGQWLSCLEISRRQMHPVVARDQPDEPVESRGVRDHGAQRGIRSWQGRGSINLHRGTRHAFSSVVPAVPAGVRIDQVAQRHAGGEPEVHREVDIAVVDIVSSALTSVFGAGSGDRLLPGAEEHHVAADAAAGGIRHVVAVFPDIIVHPIVHSIARQGDPAGQRRAGSEFGRRNPHKILPRHQIEESVDSGG